MASLALAFDVLARDKGASATFDKVGDAAERSGKRVDKAGDSGGRTGKSLGVGLKFGALAAVAGVGGLTVALGGFIRDAAESARIGRLTDAVLKSTGGVAQVSAKQVSDLATAISNKTGVDDEAIQAGENLLLTFTKVRNEAGKGNDIFNQATQAAVDLSVGLGVDLAGANIQLGKALNDPIKGVGALSRAGVSFTAEQKEQIKVLVQSGDTLGAQKVILEELAKQFGGAAAAAVSPIDRLKVALGNIGEKVGGLVLPTVERFAAFITDKLIPGAKQLFDVLFRGDFTGGGPFAEDSGFVDKVFKVRDAVLFFADKVRTEVVPRIREFGAFFVTEILPRVQQFGGYIRDTLVPIVQRFASDSIDKARAVLADLKIKFEENKGALKVLGDVILAAGRFIVEKLIPAFAATVGFIQDRITPAFGLVVDGLGFIVTASINVGRVFLGMVGTFLGGLGAIFAVLGKLPGKFGEPFRQASASIAGAKATVDTLKGGLDVLGQKIARPRVELVGADGALGSLSRLEAKLKNTGGIAKVYQRGGNTSGDGPGAGGPMLARISKLIAGTGLSVSSTYRTPARNAAIGGSPSSYHLDRSNPAVDVVGPAGALDRLQSQLRSAGGLRELLWRVPGHFDHLHAADQGGIFKGPGLVKMGPGYETFASGLRPAQKVADLPSGTGSGVTMNYYGDVHTVDVDEFTHKQTARMRDLIAVGGLA